MNRSIVLVVLLFGTGAFARPVMPEDVPAPLKPWTGWVLHGQERELCPFLHAQEQRVCVWPSRLDLDLDRAGGRLTQVFAVYGDAWIPLPGTEGAWPQELKANGAPAAVRQQDGRAEVFLRSGRHTVTGSFRWDTLPQSLPVPPSTGLVSLKVHGMPIAFPERSEDGTLWIRKEDAKTQEENRLEVVAHRRLMDDIPFQVLTRIELRISGKSREEALVGALLEGLTPMALGSALPARLERDGRLVIQARPGTFVLELTARAQGPVDKLALPKLPETWPPEEVWVFDARPHLRQVRIEGPQAIDPQQTLMPEDWKGMPAFRMVQGQGMTFVTERRGDPEPAPDQLSLSRQLWLDFDGKGYTLQDVISGTLNRSWRLDMPAPVTLGRVSVDGRDQFITRTAEDAPRGVEIRRGAVNLQADSRIDERLRAVPAVGWLHDFHSVSATLHLPPGWRLFAASGVDDAHETWLGSWTLLDLFLVLITSLAVFKLWGRAWGVVALVTMVLIFPERDAPQWAWLVVLAFEALSRVLPEGRVRRVIAIGRLGALVVLVAITVPFLVQQVRVGMYPALEHTGIEVAQGGVLGALAEQSPSSPPPLEAMAESRDEIKKLVLRDSADAVSQISKSGKQRAYLVESSAEDVLQTGPGLPTWGWNRVGLRWSGPVHSGQLLQLRLVPPWANVLLAFVR